jgi:hypothetical protein
MKASSPLRLHKAVCERARGKLESAFFSPLYIKRKKEKKKRVSSRKRNTERERERNTERYSNIFFILTTQQ